MRIKITLAMAMLAFAVTTQAQDKLKVVNGKVLTNAEYKVGMPKKEKNNKLGKELKKLLGNNRGKALGKKKDKNAVVSAVNVMVMLAPSAGVTAEVLENVGCKVHWSMKSQAFVNIPVEKLEALSEVNGILDINLPQKYQVNNEVARRETKVSSVADPISAEKAGLPQAYDGSGVVVGVVDTGIDFAHPAFRNADGTTRIKRAFTYRRTDPIQPDEPESNWKNTYTDPKEILKVTPVTSETHGSHTMGTAAGSNTGNNLQGMAPGADLVPADLVSLRNNYLISGLKSICEYAQEVGKPVVTNFSIGSPGMFRDGCSSVSQAVIELTGNGTKPGVIFSFSAGNSGHYNNYVHHTFTSDDEKLYVMMAVPSEIKDIETEEGSVQTHPLNRIECLAGFANKDVDNAEEMLIAYSLNEKRILNADEEIGFAVIYGEEDEEGQYLHWLTPTENSDSLGVYKITLNNLRDMLVREDYYGQFVHNCADGITKKRGMEFDISESMQIFLLEDVRLGGCFSMPAGTELSVLNLANQRGADLIKPEGFDFVSAGTPEGSINEEACNMGNITVGAYNVCNTYDNYLGEKISFGNPIGEVSFFTSYGYTNDGNHLAKPEVLAPGSYILSAVNGSYERYFKNNGKLLPKDEMSTTDYLAKSIKFHGQNYWYEYMQGTSMAAPVATGVIALWLQAAPMLSVMDVRDVLAHSSVPYEGSDPLKSSLYGKINALAGLKYIINNITGIDDITYSQTTNTTDDRIFTLDGREVKGIPSAGIYVVGGKKVVYRK